MLRKNYLEKFKNHEVTDPIMEEVNNEATNKVLEEFNEKIVEEFAKEKIEELTKESIIKTGVVIDCEKLNVRKETFKDSEVLCTVNKGDEVKIDLGPIDDKPIPAEISFYKICTASGVEGYCMTKYINIR